MLEQFSIFDRGGTVLWTERFTSVKGSPLNSLVRSVLVENRAGRNSFDCENYVIQWTFANDYSLVFALIALKQFRPPYAEDLLEKVKSEFIYRYGEAIKDGTIDRVDVSSFESAFRQMHFHAEAKSKTKPIESSSKIKGSAKAAKNKAVPDPKRVPVEPPPKVEPVTPVPEEEEKESSSGTDPTPLTEQEVLRKILKRSGRTHKKSQAQSTETTSNTKRVKVMREASGNKLTAQQKAALDRSDPVSSIGAEEELERVRERYINAKPTNYQFIREEDAEESKDGELPDRTVEESRMMSFFRGITGQKKLTREDLRPALEAFEEQLVGKNVALDIATQLCDSVGASLEGKVPGSFKSISGIVKRAMTEALTRLLTPKQSTDIISHAKSVREREKRPYVIAFCGVNGVGKSTSLAKICYYLQRHGLNVHLAACDTFRSGAVEQLRTHALCLGATLHEQGYNKDAANVAKYAIMNAKKGDADVVLIDTAGRMQDNEPLMRSLAKLVSVNKPDRVFFVGEALVGNDGVDQLRKFDQALVDHTPPGEESRRIDGIVLTKFDTIDDKVGAAVSMVYTTGQPIVFVGVGQTYMDLRKVNTTALVMALLR